MSKLQRYFHEWQKRGGRFNDPRKLDLIFTQALLQPLEKMAVFADPVTRMAVTDPECFLELRQSISQYDVSNTNTTSAGNLALLAIACPDPQVRRNAVFGLYWMMKRAGVTSKIPLQ